MLQLGFFLHRNAIRENTILTKVNEFTVSYNAIYVFTSDFMLEVVILNNALCV